MKITYQGVSGSYSESCAKKIYPDCETLPCKTFDECFEKASQDSSIRTIIPESNKTTGNIGVEESFDLIISCIDQIYNEEESWTSADCTKKEMVEFLDQLNSKQFKEIENFFDTMPKLSHTVKVTNPETKVKSDIVLEGLSSFFE